ncbi:MAG: hypothetical protein AAFU83_04560 [Bacteroidota bacterium]
MSTAYHPQTNGLVERTNEVIEAALRHYVSADHSDWDDQLPWVEFALNSAYHPAIGTTPFALNRVVVPKDPLVTIRLNKVRFRNMKPMGVLYHDANKMGAGFPTFRRWKQMMPASKVIKQVDDDNQLRVRRWRQQLLDAGGDVPTRPPMELYEDEENYLT